MQLRHRVQRSDQLVLFDAPLIRQKWADLPPSARQEVVRLLAKILEDYGRRSLKAAASKEVSSE